MGQLIMIDETELNNLKQKSDWFDTYVQMLEVAQKDLYPDFISVGPCNTYGYLFEILVKMKFELVWKRKPWWRKIL